MVLPVLPSDPQPTPSPGADTTPYPLGLETHMTEHTAWASLQETLRGAIAVPRRQWAGVWCSSCESCEGNTQAWVTIVPRQEVQHKNRSCTSSLLSLQHCTPAPHPALSQHLTPTLWCHPKGSASWGTEKGLEGQKADPRGRVMETPVSPPPAPPSRAHTLGPGDCTQPQKGPRNDFPRERLKGQLWGHPLKDGLPSAVAWHQP